MKGCLGAVCLYLVFFLPDLQAQTDTSLREMLDELGALVSIDPVKARDGLEQINRQINIQETPRLYFEAKRHLCFAYLTLGQMKPAHSLAESALAQTNIAQYPKFQAYFKTCRAFYFGQHQQIENALSDFGRSIDVAEQYQWYDLKALILQYRGGTFLSQGVLNLALKDFQSAHQIFTEKLQQPEEAMGALVNMAIIYNRLGQYRDAIIANTQALDFFIQQDNHYLIATINQNLGTAYFRNKQYQLAEKAINAAVQSNQTIQDYYSLISNYRRLSDIYLAQDQYTKAQASSQLALQIAREQRLEKPIQLAELQLAKIDTKVKNWQASSERLMRILKHDVKSWPILDQIQLWELLSESYFRLESYEQAFSAQSTLLSLYQDNQKRQQESILWRLKIEYDVNRVAQKYLLLSAENANQALELKLTKSEQASERNLIKILMLGLLISVMLVGLLLKQKRKLRFLARHDSLTLCFNRRAIMQHLAQEFARACRYDQVFTIAIIDIDYFKRINDTYGHPVGDEVLIYIAQLLKVELRKPDRFGRVGGEEFLIIFPNTTRSQALTVCQRVLKAFNDQKHTSNEKLANISLSFSAGIAALLPENQAVDDLITEADQQLYRAKSSGRNQVCLNENLSQ